MKLSATSTHWNPEQYLKFSDHRLRPGLELLERIPLATPELIYDLGCGTGKLTRLLAERWPEATIIGLDHSQEMLEKAAVEPSTIQWGEADAQNWQPDDPPDLIYSNAVLHWVAGHAALFPQLLGLLKPGGCLAVQMPLSRNQPSHQLIQEVLENGGEDGSPLGSPELCQETARKWVEDAEVYYDCLIGGTRNLDIWETEYLQVLEGDDPVLEWVKGTGLRPVLNGLNDEEREVFLAEYCQRLRIAYPRRDDGCTLYPFRRLFLVAMV
jgi:trans-aconitate 2-methyltransferase